jgi:hypothetical protein
MTELGPLDHLARRIGDRARWDIELVYMTKGDAPADAVTKDLRTKDNALSLWRCSADPNGVQEAVLAMVAAMSDDPPEKVFVVVVPERSLVEAGVPLRDNEGTTPVADLRKRHVNAEHLTAAALAKIASAIAASLGTGAEFFFTRKQFIEIVAEAVRKQRISLGRLGPKLRELVEIALKARAGT